MANTQGWGDKVGQQQNRVAETGVKWIREEFQWSVVEPRDDAFDFTHTDLVIGEAAKRGIRVLPLLMKTPAWAGASASTIPSDPAEYAEYVAQIVARYGPSGTFWSAHPELPNLAPEHFELWNEPYFEAFSATGVDGGRYARLVKAAAEAGQRANPRAKYLLEADYYLWDQRGPFIDQMYAAVPDLNKYFDAVAVHPYSNNRPPDAPAEEWGFRRIERIRSKFASYGAQDKPFWITEIGWSTCPSDARRCTNEQAQAENFRKLFDALDGANSGYIEAVFLYHLSDWGVGDPLDKEHWFGLTRRDGTKKPAYDVVRGRATAASGTPQR